MGVGRNNKKRSKWQRSSSYQIKIFTGINRRLYFLFSCKCMYTCSHMCKRVCMYMSTHVYRGLGWYRRSSFMALQPYSLRQCLSLVHCSPSRLRLIGQWTLRIYLPLAPQVSLSSFPSLVAAGSAPWFQYNFSSVIFLLWLYGKWH